MGIKKFEEWYCDICRGKRHNNKEKWLNFSVSDNGSMLDREYIDLIICPRCAKTISACWDDMKKEKR